MAASGLHNYTHTDICQWKLDADEKRKSQTPNDSQWCNQNNPVPTGLHWPPVKQRIDFKILLLTYKALNGLAPAYMRELLIPYSPKRTLRSTENHLLTPPRCRLEYFGKRSFAAAAPTLWNNVPLNIKQAPSVDIFKSRIKTHLFQLAYFM